MCGRYVRRSDKQRIAEAFHMSELASEMGPSRLRSQHCADFLPAVIRAGYEVGDRELVLSRWGLVPYFIEELSDVTCVSTLDARAESSETSPTWRTPFAKRRCLVPADSSTSGEIWMQRQDSPSASSMADNARFAFAGLWDAWKAPDGGWLQSFSIVTTDANKLMVTVHTRMPVILHQRDYDRWLQSEADRAPVDLLKPFKSEAIKVALATSWVGNVKIMVTKC